MSAPGLLALGRFELPLENSKKLLGQQVLWAIVQSVVAVGWVGLSMPWSALGAGLATGLGAVVARPVALHLLPLLVLGSVVGASVLGAMGMSVWVGAAIAAGLLLGRGWVGRAEAAMMAGSVVGLVSWALPWEPTSWLGLIGVSSLMAMAAAQALVPGALRFEPVALVPGPFQITRELAPMYRQPCMRAWQIDGELSRMAPDRPMREGLAEVGGWVFRLAQTTQMLDGDIGKIHVEEVESRRAALLVEAQGVEDPFIRDRQIGTASHLDRLLEHRASLVRERARAASLQDYALAYLEEARAGMAVARVLPGDQTPVQLDVVLRKLRDHAAEGGARRLAVREVERVG